MNAANMIEVNLQVQFRNTYCRSQYHLGRPFVTKLLA